MQALMLSNLLSGADLLRIAPVKGLFIFSPNPKDEYHVSKAQG